MEVFEIEGGNVNGPFPKIGQKCRMNFRRSTFTWTEDHLNGDVVQSWNDLGDDPCDRVMKTKNEFHAWLDDLKKQPDACIDPMPGFVNEQLLNQGCKFFVRYWPAVFETFSAAMFSGFGCQEACVVLLESRYWANTGEKGLKDTADRLKETACWLFDICAHGAEGFRPNGVSWASALHVRYLHGRQRHNLTNNRKDWDFSKWGVPISQVQLAGTLLGSSTLLLTLMEENLGIHCSSADREGFVHLWGTIGHLFGITDTINPCIGGYQKAMARMESILAHAIPRHPDPELTHTLTNHIIMSTNDHVLPFQSNPKMVAALPRQMLGESYADDVGLPRVGFAYHVLARVRIWCLKLLFFFFKIPILDGWMEHFLIFLFKRMVIHVHLEQPKCRFGKMQK